MGVVPYFEVLLLNHISVIHLAYVVYHGVWPVV